MERKRRCFISILLAVAMVFSLLMMPANKKDVNAEGEVIEWTLGYEFTKGQILRKGTVIKNRWEYHHKFAGYDYWCTYFNCLSVGIMGLEQRDELFGDVNREMKRTGYTYNDAGEKTGEIYEQLNETTYTIPFDCVVEYYEEPTWVSGEMGNSGVTAAGLTLIPVCSLSIYKYYLDNNLSINDFLGIVVDSGSMEKISLSDMKALTNQDYQSFNIDVIYVSSESYEQAKKWKDDGVVFGGESGVDLPDSEGVNYVRQNISISDDIYDHSILEFPYTLDNGLGNTINYTTQWEVLGFNYNPNGGNDNFRSYTLYIVSKDGAPHEHELTDWIQGENYHYKNCTKCNMRELEKGNHTNELRMSKIPTETELGKYGFYCTVCGYVDRLYDIDYEGYLNLFPPDDHVHEFSQYFYNINEHWSYCDSCANGTIREPHSLEWRQVSPETAEGAGNAKICYGCTTCKYIKEEKEVTQEEYDKLEENLENKITSIDVTIKLPEAGTKITDTLAPTISFASGANYSTAFSMFINCYPSQGTYDDGAIIGKTIEEGKEYFVEVYLSPKDGYIFDSADKVNLKVNGGTEYELGYCFDKQFAFFAKVKAEKKSSDQGTASGSGNVSGSGGKTASGNTTGSGSADKKEDKKTPEYSNEWVDGKWYDQEGKQTYEGTLTWKNDENGWWVEDSAGWYPTSCWQKIDGKYYYFTESGYMDYSEYRDGCWLGSDGAWVEDYYGGHWCSNSIGWWYEDSSGWYPVSQYVWIDGTEYWFGADGYWA